METFISVDFITRYLGTKFEGKKKTATFLIVWMVSFIELCTINQITVFETFGSYIPMVIYAIYAIACLKGSLTLKLWIAVVTHLIVIITAILSNLVICNLIGYDPYQMITVFNGIRVISVIITKGIQFYVTRILLKIKRKSPMNRHRFLSLVMIPAISVISLCALMKAVFYNDHIQPYILIGMGCIVLANIMTYYFFIIINKEYENDLQVKLLKLQNDNFEKDIENMENFINEMKSVKHDIKNQLLTINNYLSSNKIKEAKNYINALTNEYLPNIQNVIVTKNNAFDAIINSKIAFAVKKNIFMEVNIRKDTIVNWNAAEITALFGNLLDNAIEAAQLSKEKRIELNICQEGEYLSILITNSIRSSVLKENQSLETSKKNKELHGIGLKSIQNIVKKHNGMIQFYEEENEFCCHILLDIHE